MIGGTTKSRGKSLDSDVTNKNIEPPATSIMPITIAIIPMTFVLPLPIVCLLKSLRPALLVLGKQLFDRDAHRLGEPAQHGQTRIGGLVQELPRRFARYLAFVAHRDA